MGGWVSGEESWRDSWNEVGGWMDGYVNRWRAIDEQMSRRREGRMGNSCSGKDG